MGRPIGMKNNMRTPEQKEKIVIEKLNGATDKQLCSKYNISRSTIFEWLKNYRENGIKGLESQTGKCAKSGNRGRPKNTRTREEELERENLKLRIEIERLKKLTDCHLLDSKKLLDELYELEFTYQWLDKHDPKNFTLGLYRTG